MADDTETEGVSTHDWMLEQVVDDAPSLAVSAERPTGGGLSAEHTTDGVDHHDGRGARGEPPVQRGRDVRGARPHELDDLTAGESTSEECGPDINSAAKRAAVWLGSGVLLVAVLIVGAFVVFGGGPDPVAPPQHHALAPAVSAAPITTNPPVPQQDHVVPFTAHTDSCTPAGGSADQLAARSPQALTDTGTDSAWVCGRGPQESLLDGQVLHMQFICDPSRPGSACGYMLTSVSVTPGWVAKTPAGKDEWLQHRVVVRLQFNFFNGNQLVADPFFVDTHSIHGPVPAALPAKILASRVEVIILHTERPPAAPLPASTGPSRGADVTELAPPGGLVDSVSGPGTAQPAAPAPADPADGGTAGDPVDATFAMSQLQFFGHSPI
jgi:hypothetical protein